jgi:hypothetical protein
MCMSSVILVNSLLLSPEISTSEHHVHETKNRQINDISKNEEY